VPSITGLSPFTPDPVLFKMSDILSEKEFLINLALFINLLSSQ
jgi:hypothetical protein